jgi:hypothetical protein
MSRAKVFGAGSTFSLTKFGEIVPPSVPVPKRMKDMARLEAQKSIMAESVRRRRYNFCTQCGSTTLSIGFDETPSARIGLWGRCVGNKDYTHHRFVSVAKGEYDRLREMTTEERLNHWRYERDN